MRVAKSASFTRWDARPLSAEQLAYAREDVVHLLELAAELERRLEELGRLEWAREECGRSSAQRRARPRCDLRAPAAHSRHERLLATVARELIEWRERTAARADRPVQSVLGDAPLVEIAKRKPSSSQASSSRSAASAAVAGAPAQELLDAVRRGSERPPEPPPQAGPPAGAEPDDAPLVALAEALIRARAREAGLAYELLAARADLQAIVAARRERGDEADVRTLRGWRRELVGTELLELLDGRVSLSVSDGKIRVKPDP